NVIGMVVSKLNAIRAAQITGDITQNVNFAVHSAIVTSVLDSYSIDYEISLSEATNPISDIVSKAQPAVVAVECVSEGDPIPNAKTLPPARSNEAPAKTATL